MIGALRALIGHAAAFGGGGVLLLVLLAVEYDGVGELDRVSGVEWIGSVFFVRSATKVDRQQRRTRPR